MVRFRATPNLEPDGEIPLATAEGWGATSDGEHVCSLTYPSAVFPFGPFQRRSLCQLFCIVIIGTSKSTQTENRNKRLVRAIGQAPTWCFQTGRSISHLSIHKQTSDIRCSVHDALCMRCSVHDAPCSVHDAFDAPCMMLPMLRA